MLIGQWEHCSCSAFVGGGGREGGGWRGGFIGVQQEETEEVESCKNKKEK